MRSGRPTTGLRVCAGERIHSTIKKTRYGNVSDESQVLGIIKDFILNEFLEGEDPDELTEKTELLTTGILDSLATLKLITYIEEQFDMEIEADEADETHLNTLEDIVSLLKSKR